MPFFRSYVLAMSGPAIGATIWPMRRTLLLIAAFNATAWSTAVWALVSAVT